MLPARFAHAGQLRSGTEVMVPVLNLAVHMIYILSGYMCYVLAAGSA